MLHKLIIHILIIAIAIQTGRDALISLWFLANREAITDQYCINQDEPLLMCQGTCYLQNVLEEQHQPNDHNPLKIPSTEERISFILPLIAYQRVQYIDVLLQRSGDFYYTLPKSRLAIASLFHPPQV